MNKEMIPQTKAAVQNSELMKVYDLIAEIKEDPEVINELRQNLAQAVEAGRIAAKAKEEAEAEADFDKACDDAVRAREKEAFYRRIIEEKQFTPRLDDDRYFETVDSVKTVVRDAADAFRAVAEKAMAQIVQAKADYWQTVIEADMTLNALNDAANVLQSKYKDQADWRRNAFRFYDGWRTLGVNLAIMDFFEDRPPEYNDTLAAAWRAAERAAK